MPPFFPPTPQPHSHTHHPTNTIPGLFQGGPQKYTKKYAAGSLAQVLDALKQLRDHGCERCGSVPMGPHGGWLTFNFMYAGCLEKPKTEERKYKGVLVCE